MRARFKKWARPFIDENSDYIITKENLDSKEFNDFLLSDDLYIEIGPGKGSFMLTMAQNNTDKKFLCVEKNLSISAQFAKLLKEADITNVFIISSDIAELFDILSNRKVKTIFLNHPDPWPKKRHEKRRLTSKDFLAFYAKILDRNAPLILKTDNSDMFDFSVESLKENGWEIIYINYDYQDDDSFDAITNYEKAWRSKNVKIKRLKAIYKGEEKC